MAITAPLSKYEKNNLKIYIAALIVVALWCVYDGYFNEKWIKEHTNADGTAQTYLVFNRKAPYYLGGAAVLFAVYFLAIRDRKVVAENTELIINDRAKIAYDSIEKVDKTNFKSKGYFIITYKDPSGRKVNRKLSDRKYDNLESVLNEIVTKIS